jgi:hypothetical protein
MDRERATEITCWGRSVTLAQGWRSIAKFTDATPTHRIPSIPTLICTYHNCNHRRTLTENRVNYHAFAPHVHSRRALRTCHPQRIASVSEHLCSYGRRRDSKRA